MKTKTVNYLEVTYTVEASGNKTLFYARTISVNMDKATLTDRDDPSHTITIRLCDMHEIKKGLVVLPCDLEEYEMGGHADAEREILNVP